MRSAVFLDRDGVLNRSVRRSHTEYGSPRRLEELEILPGVREAFGLIKKIGFLTIVVTNQPEISRGFLSVADLDAIHGYLRDRLPIDDIYVCQDDDGARCSCRKPKPGMLLSAAEKWRIDLGQSFLVGDRAKDIQAGRAAGVTTILVGAEESALLDPPLVAPDLLGAVLLISAQDQDRQSAVNLNDRGA